MIRKPQENDSSSPKPRHSGLGTQCSQPVSDKVDLSEGLRLGLPPRRQCQSWILVVLESSVEDKVKTKVRRSVIQYGVIAALGTQVMTYQSHSVFDGFVTKSPYRSYGPDHMLCSASYIEPRRRVQSETVTAQHSNSHKSGRIPTSKTPFDSPRYAGALLSVHRRPIEKRPPLNVRP